MYDLINNHGVIGITVTLNFVEWRQHLCGKRLSVSLNFMSEIDILAMSDTVLLRRENDIYRVDAH